MLVTIVVTSSNNSLEDNSKVVIGDREKQDTSIELLKMQRESLNQNQKTYDTFLAQQNLGQTRFMTLATIFGITLAIFIGFMTFLGIKYFDFKFKEIKEKLIEDQKVHINRRIDEQKSEFTDLIRDIHETPINKLSEEVSQTDLKLSKLIEVLRDRGIDIKEDAISSDKVEESSDYKEDAPLFKDFDIEVDSDKETKNNVENKEK